MSGTEILAILMLVTFFILLMIGVPVALTLATTGFVFGVIGFGPGLFNLLPARIYGVVANYQWLAIPLFVFMGVMLEKSRLADDLLDVVGHIAGGIKGGMGVGIILVGVLMGATTGIVGATVVTLGLLTLPTLLRRGYDPGIACGAICASGTLGQIIPPSLILILLADILQLSVGTLFCSGGGTGLAAGGHLLRLHPDIGVVEAAPDAAHPGAGARCRVGARTVDAVFQGGGAAGVTGKLRCSVRSSGVWLRRPRPRQWERWAPSWLRHSPAAFRGRCCAKPARAPPRSPP